LHWIRSTQKAEQDESSRQERMERAREKLRQLQTKINTYNLKQRQQIVQRIEGILKTYRCEKVICYKIDATREYKRKYQGKGRPKKGSSSEITWKQIYSVSFGVDEDALKEEEKVDGVFPLLTNLDRESHSAKKVLEIYKFQPFIEKRFSQLKTYQEIAPVYLKKSQRVVAFLHIHVMALMVSGLIERTLRLGMKKEKLKSLPIYPEKRPCKSPTLFDIVRLFRDVERYEVQANHETIIFPAKLTREQKQVLNLLGVSISEYQ
jgi:transposase